MKGITPCASCNRLLDVWGNSKGEHPPAYSEDVIGTREHPQTIYFCHDCTLAAYAYCENVWITCPPAPTCEAASAPL